MPEPPLPRRQRRAVRAILIDPARRVLLLHGHDPGVQDADSWWFTPGGGVRFGEDPVDALRRECWEELGFVPDGIAGPIARRRHAFVFDGQWLDQDTHYYWARVPAFDPAPGRLTARERRFLLGWRWWDAGEFPGSPEQIYPEDLADLVKACG